MSKLSTVALALLMAGCADAAQAAGPMVTGHGAAPADRAFAAANDAMMKGMDVKPSGDPDRDFVAMMLPHHQGAVDMAKVELRYGRDPMLRRLAAGIVEAQRREIAEMRNWQRRHAR